MFRFFLLLDLVKVKKSHFQKRTQILADVVATVQRFARQLRSFARAFQLNSPHITSAENRGWGWWDGVPKFI